MRESICQFLKAKMLQRFASFSLLLPTYIQLIRHVPFYIMLILTMIGFGVSLITWQNKSNLVE